MPYRVNTPICAQRYAFAAGSGGLQHVLPGRVGATERNDHTLVALPAKETWKRQFWVYGLAMLPFGSM